MLGLLTLSGVIDFALGCVVTVTVPAVYNWVKAKVTVVEADAKQVTANTISSAVSSAVDAVKKDL